MDRSLGFLLAKASQRWNELLAERFAARGFPEVRASYGSILVPLFEEEGLQIVELARRAGLSKQTLTTQLRALEEKNLVARRNDPRDGRAFAIFLTPRGRAFKRVASSILDDLEGDITNAMPRDDIVRLKRQLAMVMAYGKEGDGHERATA
jgi:MarR family transcriptional regulator, organic hydroperoxide resistance regulator